MSKIAPMIFSANNNPKINLILAIKSVLGGIFKIQFSDYLT
jgi:hypothetical protein